MDFNFVCAYSGQCLCDDCYDCPHYIDCDSCLYVYDCYSGENDFEPCYNVESG